MVLIFKFQAHRFVLATAMLSGLLLNGCALPASTPPGEPAQLQLATPGQAAHWHEYLTQFQTAQVIMLGEQHDAPEHHALEEDTVRELAGRQRLAAVVLEMADAGTSTQGLPPSASEADAQTALRWNDKAWPWKSYGPAVMTAVRANIPVFGGNLPRPQMGPVMQDGRFDDHFKAEELQIQLNAIKDGHCGLLPESQLQPMVRIQLARDESMANVVKSAVKDNRTVLLIAGHGHVRTKLGVPIWLPQGMVVRTVIAQTGKVNPALAGEADLFIVTPALPEKDHCAELREKFKR